MKKVTLFLILLFSVSCLLAEMDFYGSIRTGWWYTMTNKDYNLNNSNIEESRLDFTYKFNSNSRAGFNYAKENFTANVELGLSESSVYVRHAYGEQDLGNFKLLVGRTYTGFADISAQGYGIGTENNLIGYGMLFDSRNTQVRFTFPSGLYFSLIEPAKMTFIPSTPAFIDAIIPKINVGMKYEGDNFKLHPTFGLAMSNYNDNFTGHDESILAYALSIAGKYNLDPVTLHGQINFGQNIGNYGFSTISPYSVARWDSAKEEIVNSTTLGGYLEAIYDVATFGVGYISDNRDDLKNPDATMTLFGQYKFQFGNISFIPEIGMINYMEDGFGTKEGTVTYFGTEMKVSIP